MKDFEISTILTAKVFLWKISAKLTQMLHIDINTLTVANLEYYYNERVTLEIEIV